MASESVSSMPVFALMSISFHMVCFSVWSGCVLHTHAGQSQKNEKQEEKDKSEQAQPRLRRQEKTYG
jgi:hypothetical protein